jgi:FAM92 protein
LENVANGLTFLADHKTLEIQRLEQKVLDELCQYEFICSNTREEVKNQMTLRERELSKRKQLDKVKRAKNENEIIMSNMQISKILKEIAMIAEQFELQKVRDMKEVLRNFVLIQMKYHASCLEVLTMMNDDITSISVESDVEVSL